MVPELEPEFEIILRSVMRYAGLMDLTMFDHGGDATSAKALSISAWMPFGVLMTDTGSCTARKARFRNEGEIERCVLVRRLR